LIESLGENIARAFSNSSAQGVVQLAGMVPNIQLPPELRWWRSLGRLLLTTICADLPYDLNQSQIQRKVSSLQNEAPPFSGSEYIPLVIADFWEGMISELEKAAKGLKSASISAYVRTTFPLWAQVGRVIFHLAEKTNDEQRPFAFIVTYDRTDFRGEKSVMPIGRAMQEFTASGDQHALLSMLEPLHEAQKGCEFLTSLISSGEIFHPLALTAREAFEVLKNVPHYQKAGIVLKYPKWTGGKPQRPQLAVVIGDKKSSAVGFDGLVDFSLQVALGEKRLTKKEIADILRAGEGLVRIKGEWVEIHHDSFSGELNHWRTIEKQVQKSGLSLADAMRLLSGATDLTSFKSRNSDAAANENDSGPKAGRWLDDVLQNLRYSVDHITRPSTFLDERGTTRPFSPVIPDNPH
jgi:non-specific serine/threonine protein kinase